jgi:hypothetical protein
MTDLDEQGRPEPPLAGDETATLVGFLEYQRATFAWKCGGLDAAGLDATVGVSSMTLGGMLKHLAYVEDMWFSRFLYEEDAEPPWDTVDWDADPDWGLALRRRGLACAAPGAVAGRRGPFPFSVHNGACGRRPGPAGAAHLAGRPGAQPAVDPVPHDRGVRAA